jgi:hypothetical protein
MTRNEPASERLDLHNASIDVATAMAGRCGFTHLPSGRVCLLPRRHRHDCRFAILPRRQRTPDEATAGSAPAPLPSAPRPDDPQLLAAPPAFVPRGDGEQDDELPLRDAGTRADGGLLAETDSGAGRALVLPTTDDDRPASREALQQACRVFTRLGFAAGPPLRRPRADRPQRAVSDGRGGTTWVDVPTR